MLKAHLLPRIQKVLQQEAELESIPHTVFQTTSTGDFVILKEDCLYVHKLLRFHFTAYNVRHRTDIINTGTSRCNIMLLADGAHDLGMISTSAAHHFLYARVIGAYHANVIYIGPGMCYYQPRRFNFLWVQWYKVVNPVSSGWTSLALDMISFPPMNRDDSFVFVDPKDVLHRCHILPAFAKGKQHANGVGISRSAKDGKDYKMYYVGR